MNGLPGFRGLDPHREVRIYRRNLPHWRQDGATYFVTFRLGDSIPEHVLHGWEIDRRTWLTAHGLTPGLDRAAWLQQYRQIPRVERERFERAEARRLFREVDKGHGCCALAKESVRQLVVEALHFFDGERCRTGDFTVMPNHVHWLVLPLPGHELEAVLQSIKRFTSGRIRKLEPRLGSGPVWQDESHDRLVRDRRELAATRRYIAHNPQKAGLPGHACSAYVAEWLDTDPETADPHASVGLEPCGQD